MPVDELNLLASHGIIDLSHIEQQVEMIKRNELLKCHPYRTWQGKNGKWYTYIDEMGVKKLKKRNTREEIEDLIVSYQKESQTGETVRDVFKEWVDWKLENKKIIRSTHLRYEQTFDKFYDKFGNKKIRRLRPEEFVDFLESQIPKYELTAKGFANLKTITRGFLKRAKRRKLIDWNVDYMLTELEISSCDYKKTVREAYQEVFNETETKAVMDYLIGHQDEKNLALLLIFITGLRVGETVALKPEDLEQKCIHVRRTETRYRENGKFVYDVKDFPKTAAGVRTVVVPKEYEWVLKKVRHLNPFGKWVFESKGKRIKEALVCARLRSICSQLSIYQKSPHKIRKTYVSMLLDSKVDARMILEQVGHASITVSEVSYHRNRKSIEKKQEILGEIEEFSNSYRGNQKGNKGKLQECRI